MKSDKIKDCYKDILSWKKYEWATDDQKECCQMIFDLIGGEHHLVNKIKPFGKGIEYNGQPGIATFDFSLLTLLVFMAHDRMIRASIQSSGPGMIKIVLFKRHYRQGPLCDRHPTIEDALKKYRGL